METTLVVSLTLKVNAEGNSSDELIADALDTALEKADALFGSTWNEGVPGISVEGATVLADRKALDSYFKTVR